MDNILAVISQKGGPGKTMLATNLATAASMAGHSVILIDTDPQCSAAKWWDRRKNRKGNKKPYVIASPTARLEQLLEVSDENGATLAIIDTAPNVEAPLMDVVKASTFILIPSRPANVDIEAIPSTLAVIKIEEKPTRIVFNAVRPNSNIGIEARASAADLDVKGLDVVCVPFDIGERLGFVRAFNDGSTVLEEEPDSNSAREINRLFNYLEKEMTQANGK